MPLKVNFTDVADRMPARPEGWYHVKVTDGEVKEVGEKGKNPGQEYMTIEFTIQDGEFKGQKFWSGMHLLNERALGIVKGFLRATSRFTEAQLNGELEFDSWDEFLSSVRGADLMLRNKHREWDGEKQDNPSGFKALEGNTVDTAKAGVSPGSSLLP